jgi:serine/threonine protein phosphatase PrpC
MKCPNCGHENQQDARFCHRCNTALTAQNPVAPNTSSSVSSAPVTDTHPLAELGVAFAPLPEGALLHDGQYAVLAVHATDEQLNVYLVEDTTPIRLCLNCHAQTSELDEQFCSFCGADISEVEPLHLRYLVRESADEQAFAVEAQLLEMQLEHPGLLLPHDIFVEAPYGPNRRYLVEPEFSSASATTLPIPQKLVQVIKWGVSLAQALDYLHRRQVTLCGGNPVEADAATGISLEQIAVGEGAAWWMHLDRAYVIPPAERLQAADYFVQDVQSLATTLLYLATGERQYTTDLSLPEQAAALFSQALATPDEITAADFAIALEDVLEKLIRPDSVTLVFGRRTDVGQERSLNEDSLLTLDMASVFRSVNAPVGLFVVADGMGGHDAGDVASRLAIRTVAQVAVGEVLAPAASGEPLPKVKEWLTGAIQAANQTVYDQCEATGSDMGTTLVMALFVGDTATIANVGDSRAYLFKQRGKGREGGILQITTDHSLVERLVAIGQLTPEEAAHHPQKNVIYRVIGDKHPPEVDLFEKHLEPGDALLLCSDGLSGMVADKEMWRIWHTSASPQDACDRLIEAANQVGGVDNITAVIVQVRR